ncbi:MAG: penicillin-binding transpeptidase domain-containing protein [Chitinophagaceae bacterium]|jgi:beta-lactamase class D|nr:penicillin-binding transpeptidase domain-containing protein [Chitinophagaceae bacterium]
MNRFRVLFTVILILSAASLAWQGCTVNNVDIDNSLKKHFDAQQADGCFGMFDNSRGRFTIYNLDRFKKPYSPASTFKIVNALVALHTGRLANDSAVIPWDGVTRSRPEWNQDLSLYQAFRVSALPHFQEIARRIGKDTMKFWLDTLKYGNMNMGSTADAFWIDQSLRITPDEQLGLVKRLYFRQLPFRASVQESVKKMMIRENNTLYQLAYKTGMGQTPQGKPMGWMVGWIEENRHVYPFVLNLETDPSREGGLPEAREKVLKDILGSLGFFKGKM